MWSWRRNEKIGCTDPVKNEVLRKDKEEMNILRTIKIRKTNYEGHLESKERFAIKKYLLIIGKKKNMRVLSHTFAYFST